MTTQIWIETVKRPDGRKRYSTERGLLLIARLGSPDSEILVHGAHNVVCEGLSCPHEPRQCMSKRDAEAGVDYAYMTGDIEQAPV